MKSIVVTIVAALAAAACLVEAAAPAVDRLVATSDHGGVRFFEIACPDTLRSRDTAACRQHEQSELRRQLAFIVVDAAASEHGLRPTATEAKQIDAKVAAVVVPQERAVRHFRALLAALKTVKDGTASADAAFATLDPKEFTRKEFDGYAEQLTLGEIRDLLAQDALAVLQQSARKSYTMEVEAPKVAQYIRDSAARNHISDAEAERRLWADTVASIHLRLTTTEYTLPDFKGVLERHEETRVHPAH